MQSLDYFAPFTYFFKTKDWLKYLMVFLIVGLALFNIILLVAAVTAFLLVPPLLAYAGLVSAQYAGQLARLDRNYSLFSSKSI
jgi:hypothetical protein